MYRNKLRGYKGLGFKSISVERKIQAVSRVVSGEKLQPVAKDVDEVSMGIKVLEHKERGFNPFILISDLLPTYRVISGYFNACLHQLCTIHSRHAIARIIRNLPLEARREFFQ